MLSAPPLARYLDWQRVLINPTLDCIVRGIMV